MSDHFPGISDKPGRMYVAIRKNSMPENPIAGTKGIRDIPTGGHGHCFSAGPFVPIPERAE